MLSPTASGLQRLLNTISTLFIDCKMIINVDKTVSMLFDRKNNRANNNLNFYIDGNVLYNFKYFGCVLTKNLCEAPDMERCATAFNRSFGFLFRKFNSVNIDVFNKLFQSFCTSFYGSELWVDRKICLFAFKHLAVSYHAALKKILGFPKFYSNHFTCSLLNTMTFENFINFKSLRFLFWLDKSKSPCFKYDRIYFHNNSI